MSSYKITGGKPLHGTVKTSSAKNSAVSILCACAAIKGTTTLVDVPRIEEVERIIEVLNSIGVSVHWSGKNTLIVENKGRVNLKTLDRTAFEKTRSAFMLVGALASQFKTFSIYKPGGCRLGSRTLTPHILAFEQLGITFQEHKDSFIVNTAKRRAADFTMYEMSDTGTENAVLAAVLTPGKTTIRFAGSNYMVQDLCYFLERAGANIKGIGTATLETTGVKSLKPVTRYPIIPDPIDAMAFIAVAITTRSKLTIANAPITFLALELEKLRVMGQKFTVVRERVSKNKKFRIADITLEPSTLTALADKIHAQPYPGLNIDNLPLFVPILTQAKGTTLVHDWVFENRAIYYTELNKLGAQVELQDPHRAFVTGPTKLLAAEVICPPALRPAMNVLIGMLAAKGISTLRNLYSIKRGYADIIERLRALGAHIEAIEE